MDELNSYKVTFIHWTVAFKSYLFVGNRVRQLDGIWDWAMNDTATFHGIFFAK